MKELACLIVALLLSLVLILATQDTKPQPVQDMRPVAAASFLIMTGYTPGEDMDNQAYLRRQMAARVLVMMVMDREDVDHTWHRLFGEKTIHLNRRFNRYGI